MQSPQVLWNTVFPHWAHKIRLPASLKHISEFSQNDAERRYAERVEAAPKIELHVHMEAAVSEAFYAERNALLRLFDEEKLPNRRAPFANLRAFIDAWIDNSKLIDSPEIFRAMAIEFVKNRFVQNIVYSEVHFSSIDFSMMRRRFGFAEPLDLEACMRATLQGIKEAEQLYPGICVRLIADGLWPANVEEREAWHDVLARVVADACNVDRHGHKIIVAVGLGGPELTQKSAEILPFVDRFRKLGLKMDIHSGENVSFADHKNSVEVLEPDRIGHGISGAPEGWFFSKHIAACPLSNHLTGSFSGEGSAHPVALMKKKKLDFSVNSDDPLLFGTTLTLEYVALQNAFQIDFFEETQAAAARAVFAPEALKGVLG